MNKVKIHGIYKHFKGDYYIVEDIAKDCETLGAVVLYRALYGDGQLWARSIESFTSEVDHEKYPQVEQKNKFELIKRKSVRE